jgi:hypothetical protein
MTLYLDRRRQPQTSIKAIRDALKEIDWVIKEITSHRFISPSNKWVNESFGYELIIPRSMASLKKCWIGYLSHKDTQPGIYSALTPYLRDSLKILKQGYCEAPFSEYLLIKQLLSQKKIDQLEKDCGQTDIKRIIKEILLQTYPFAEKK